MALTEYISEYGVRAVLVALVAIAITGFVKTAFKAEFTQLGAAKSKTVYQIIITLLAIALAAIELAVTKRLTSFAVLAEEATLSYTAAQVMYPVYENYHVRDLVKMALGAIEKMLEKRGG